MKHLSLRTVIGTLLCFVVFIAFAYAGAPGSALRRVLDKTSARAGATEGFPSVVSVPILSFHHLSEAQDAYLTPDAFEGYLRVLTENGYTAVLYQDLVDFADQKKPLPEKPVMITFDDGYTSNYTYAYPLLKKWNMKAEIAVVGFTVGYDYFPDTSSYRNIIPHFTWMQAREMVESGLVSIHSHSYNLHQYDPNYDSNVEMSVRLGTQRLDGEAEEDYVRILTLDATIANRAIQNNLGYENRVYTYPYSQYNDLSEAILDTLGIRVTVTNTPGISDIEWGKPKSLKLLRRLSCDAVGLDILKMIEEAYRTIQ